MTNISSTQDASTETLLATRTSPQVRDKPVPKLPPKTIRDRVREQGWWWETGAVRVSFICMSLLVSILYVVNGKPLRLCRSVSLCGLHARHILTSYVDSRDVTHPAQLTGFRFLDDYEILPPHTHRVLANSNGITSVDPGIFGACRSLMELVEGHGGLSCFFGEPAALRSSLRSARSSQF